MARFKLGQKVVCITNTDSWWCDVRKIYTDLYPRYNEVYTVAGYSDEFDSHYGYGIFLEEIGMSPELNFGENNFEPLADISELTEILQKEEIEV